MAPSDRIAPMTRQVPIRWRIFGFLFAIGFLEYLQQRGLTIAADRMMPELHLSQLQIGWIEQSFVIGYALFTFLGSIFCQRWGARWSFVGIGLVSVMSIAATAVAPELLKGSGLFVVLVTMQFVLGAGQGPTFPVSTGVFETWFPARQWALVQGLQTMGLGLGGALAPPFIAALMTTIGWQRALWWTALPAIPLFLWWGWYGRNSPREHRGVSARELAEVPQAAVKPTNALVTLPGMLYILRDRQVMMLTFAYFTMNYVYYLLGNWCFLYLVQQRHFSVLDSGWLAMAPPVAAGVGAGVGGVLSSALFTRIGCRRGLQLTPLIALPLAGILLLVAVHAAGAITAVALLTLCYFSVELTEGSFWATAMTLGRDNTMVVGGVLNLGGSLGGVLGIPIVAYLSGRGEWNAAFLIGACFALASAIAWVFIDPSHSVSKNRVVGVGNDPYVAPRPLPGALAHTTGFSSPADLDAGSAAAGAANAGAFTVGDNLDPE
jgi:ACS family glucarate transporter-like MFS transporter